MVFQQSVTQSEVIHKGWYFNSWWHRARSFLKDGISTVGDTERGHSQRMVFQQSVTQSEVIHKGWYFNSRGHSQRMVFQQSVTQSEVIHPGWYFNSRWHRARSFALENKTKGKRTAYEFVTGWLRQEIVNSVACSFRVLDPTGWKPVSNFKHRFKPTSLFQGRSVPEREAWNDGPFFRSSFRVEELFIFLFFYF